MSDEPCAHERSGITCKKCCPATNPNAAATHDGDTDLKYSQDISTGQLNLKVRFPITLGWSQVETQSWQRICPVRTDDKRPRCTPPHFFQSHLPFEEASREACIGEMSNELSLQMSMSIILHL